MGNEQTEAERLAVVETKVDNLDRKVDGVDENVSHLHKKFDAFLDLFMTNKEADARFATVNTRIDQVASEVREIRSEISAKRHNVPTWVAAGAAILTAVYAYFK